MGDIGGGADESLNRNQFGKYRKEQNLKNQKETEDEIIAKRLHQINERYLHYLLESGEISNIPLKLILGNDLRNFELIGDILADISLLYRLKEEGSGINFTPEIAYEIIAKLDHE